jgi:uncharacterized membrane protein YphA (DoxX/SURF4 family)
VTKRVVVVLRLLLACVFLYAAYTKLRQPWLVFAMSIDAYRLLPEWAVLTAARTIPLVELAIGILLLTGWALPFVSGAAVLILGVFFGVMLASFGKGMGIDCGCFGLGETLSAKTLVRDGALLGSAVLLMILSIRRGRAGR